jgi:hypothetical protein
MVFKKINSLKGFEMLLTIDVKESALDKIMNVLNSFKSEVKIVEKRDSDEISDDENEYYVNLLKNMTAEDREVASVKYVTI